MDAENTRLDINKLLDVAMAATGSRSLKSATSTQHLVQKLTIDGREYKLFITLVRTKEEEGLEEIGVAESGDS